MIFKLKLMPILALLLPELMILKLSLFTWFKIIKMYHFVWEKSSSISLHWVRALLMWLVMYLPPVLKTYKKLMTVLMPFHKGVNFTMDSQSYQASYQTIKVPQQVITLHLRITPKIIQGYMYRHKINQTFCQLLLELQSEL